MPWWSSPYGMAAAFVLVLLLVILRRTHIWRNIWTLQRRTQSEITRVFVDVYRAIDRGTTVREMLGVAARSIARQIGGDASMVQLLDEDGHQLEEVRYRLEGNNSDWGSQCLNALDVEERREPCYVRNVKRDPCVFSSKPFLEQGFTSFLYVPVIKNDTIRGRFWIFSHRPLRYPRDRLDLLSSLGGLHTIAIERMSLIDILKARSYQDELTGMYNRRYFHLRLGEEIARSGRGGEPLSLLVCDLDNFRALNEVLGHQGGDRVLREVGQVMRTSLRTSDVATRYGGDEFAVILPDTDSVTALSTGRRLVHAVQSASSILREVSPFGISMSIGLAAYPGDADSIEDLISKADRAMLAAKHRPEERIMTWKVLQGSEEEVPSRLSLNNIVQELAFALAEIVDRKDGYVFEHSRLVSEQSALLAKDMGFEPEEIRRIQMAGLLHDVGKFAVPEEILNKSTPLGEEGWEGIKIHSVAAGDILAHIRGLRTITPIVKSIHENYDGTGYPDGVSGDDIPIEARIISVVDAYWAMRSPRPYRGAFSHEDALAAVKADVGIKFDPQVVEAFLEFCGKLRFKEGVRRLYVRSS